MLAATMDAELRRIVESRLEGAGLSDEAGLMALAALEGLDALTALLATAARGEGELPDAPVASERGDTPAIYLRSIAVEGFRGIGPRALLELEAAPGLTLVIGRNGSGKSSFAEGLEILLTGESYRWKDRSAIWKEGWRNLHHAKSTEIEAAFQVERHPGSTVLRRTWEADDEIDGGVGTAQHHGKPRMELEELGWRNPLVSYRPFLSFNELGAMFSEGPATLYDQLSAILGLEDLVTAQQDLRQARLTRAREAKELLLERDRSLVPQLKELDDLRAQQLISALDARKMDLDAAAAVLTGSDSSTGTSELGALARLMAIQPPDPDKITEAASELRRAAQALDAVSGTDSALARDTLELLESALALHGNHGLEQCPVCEEGTLGESWARRVNDRIGQLAQAAAQAEEAQVLAAKAQNLQARALAPPPSALAEAHRVGLDGQRATAAWQRWIETAPLELPALADHLENGALEIAELVTELVETARQRHASLEDRWRPVAVKVAAFVDRARTVLAGEAQVDALSSAEEWLKDALAEIRNERFAPIAEQSTAIWERFAGQSHVELAHVELTGSQTSRRVVLAIRVDGKDGAALAVMSQELHALALSLFLPRATLPESPFNFLVIDDPVQAMDPIRVDGLARVLDDVARTRQVIVFTHDDRLPEAVRRLGIDARVIEVVRRNDSVIELRTALDPVARYLDDARALVQTDDLPAEVAERVVPGFCRLALEAASAEVTRRRRIGRGDSHAEVEAALREARKLSHRMALALFDDAERTGDVLPRLNRMGVAAANAYVDCNRGSHESCEIARLPSLVQDVTLLTRELRAVR